VKLWYSAVFLFAMVSLFYTAYLPPPHPPAWCFCAGALAAGSTFDLAWFGKRK
jgi:hypothetical protein